MALLRRALQVPLSRAFATSCRAQDKVGFVGVGNMGGPMAQNLIKGGHTLTVYDIDENHLNTLRSAGAEIADSPSGVAKDADVVITMLPSSPHVIEVFTGGNGLLGSLEPGTMCLDASTIDPAVSKSMSELVHGLGNGCVFAEAPVSGGVPGAQAGTLTFMVGAAQDTFNNFKPILENMGKNIVHCGDVGTGQAAKICNNMLLGIHMLGASEAMNLGIKLGIDPKLLAGILNTSSGKSWVTDIYNPCPGVVETAPASRGYDGGFGAALMKKAYHIVACKSLSPISTKDLGLARDAALASGALTPLGSLTQDMYAELVEEGYGEKDFSVMYKYLENYDFKNEK
eukprot:m.51810 g.51810  ORF g.51810 m.51810 type:complete len:342 (+) comp10754_c0_seq2:84-1109(+)